ncbi:hypothetical protein Afe04nite_20780 [Asanoa ferruginea]|nr:BTAD domain-containing putative transcriptional regulator [Asanoa ferruginea]GIF47539.1 hypothetical protein Afe04nite_20780 [Asanoa ferruginea]
MTPAPGAGNGSVATPVGWITVAGGVVGVGLAAALIYSVRMVWKRRRHRFRPASITSPILQGADLTTPLAALARLRHGLRRAAPDVLDQSPDHGPTVHEYVAADVKPSITSWGPSGAELAGVGTLPVTVGLGLNGPAALDAARGILVAALTAGDLGDSRGQGCVIIPSSTLATLLGVTAVDLRPMRRLTVAETFAAALGLLEEEIIRRSRIVADREVVTGHALREEWIFDEPLPQLLLIADVPDPTWHTRLDGAIRLGQSVDIGAVLIGAWRDGTTLTVAPDGTTQGGNGEHVAVLDTPTTAQVLAMLAEAHDDLTSPAPAPKLQQFATEARPPRDRNDHAPRVFDTVVPSRQVADPPSPAERQPTPPAETTPTQVNARVLGEPAILDRSGRPVRGLRAKSLELFVYLVVHRAGANLDDIMEALWPDVTVSRAADRLSTCVANLRTTIRSIAQTGTERATNATKIEPVINTGGRYHLDPRLLQVDWWTVQDAYAQAATADNEARLTHLQAAIGVVTGGLADGSDYEWIDTDREHTRRRLLTIYAQAGDLQIDNHPDTALALYDTARALDPLCEDLARRAMRTAARLGDAAGVRDRLTSLRRELDDNGLEIDPDTEKLASTLLREMARP